MRVKFGHSLRMKLTILLLCLTTGIFLSYFLINHFFLENYYLNTKEERLIDGYKDINKILKNEPTITTDVSNRIAKICESSGITIIIVDTADKIELQYGNAYELRERLRQINFGDNSDFKVIKKTNKYILQRYEGNGDASSAGYMEISGFFDSNRIFLMRMAVESIHESVSISMHFFIYVGTAVSAIGIIIAFIISGEFTKPILKLANISRRMSELDFDAKYNIESNDEIAVLGSSMNELSEKLEKTILELKQANTDLKRDIQKKEEIDEMRKDFISNVSHELKTPIALIQGYAEGLSECINEDEESREFYCDVIIDEADKMNKMVKNLLTLNQLEFGNMSLQIEKFDINLVIKGVIHTIDYLVKQKKLKIDFDAQDEIYVFADEFKIEEVITNYLTNAIHHVDENGIIKVKTIKSDNKVKVCVFNSGKNIPEKEIEQIWEKFYKVDKARTREYGGSGIGLSIVKAIMNAHSQNYGINNLSNGVEFWFELDAELG